MLVLQHSVWVAVFSPGVTAVGMQAEIMVGQWEIFDAAADRGEFCIVHHTIVGHGIGMIDIVGCLCKNIQLLDWTVGQLADKRAILEEITVPARCAIHEVKLQLYFVVKTKLIAQCQIANILSFGIFKHVERPDCIVKAVCAVPCQVVRIHIAVGMVTAERAFAELEKELVFLNFLIQKCLSVP